MKKLNIFFICMLLFLNMTSVLASSGDLEIAITSGEENTLLENSFELLENIARRKYNDSR